MPGRPSPPDAFEAVSLPAPGGTVDARFYPATDARSGVIWVGGVGGGWDTPARDLYPTLAAEFQEQGIASLRVRYRAPTNLSDCVQDVLAGIDYLTSRGIEQMALAGHSLGGAVVIQTAARSESVRTVVTLSTQSYGALQAADLAPRCSILLIHGAEDPILPQVCSEQVYGLAGEPKRLVILEGADHVLESAAAEVHHLVRDWLRLHLGRATNAEQ